MDNTNNAHAHEYQLLENRQFAAFLMKQIYYNLISFESYKNRISFNFLCLFNNIDSSTYCLSYIFHCMRSPNRHITTANECSLFKFYYPNKSFVQTKQPKNKLMYNWKALFIPNSLSLSQSIDKQTVGKTCNRVRITWNSCAEWILCVFVGKILLGENVSKTRWMGRDNVTLYFDMSWICPQLG